MKIHTQYERSRLSGFKEEDFKDFPLKNLYAPECGHFWPGGHNLNKLSRTPLGDNTYQISKLYPLRFQKRRLFNVFLYDSM